MLTSNSIRTDASLLYPLTIFFASSPYQINDLQVLKQYHVKEQLELNSIKSNFENLQKILILYSMLA